MRSRKMLPYGGSPVDPGTRDGRSPAWRRSAHGAYSEEWNALLDGGREPWQGSAAAASPIHRSIAAFCAGCRKPGIRFSALRPSRIAMPDLVQEERFRD